MRIRPPRRAAGEPERLGSRILRRLGVAADYTILLPGHLVIGAFLEWSVRRMRRELEELSKPKDQS